MGVSDDDLHAFVETFEKTSRCYRCEKVIGDGVGDGTLVVIEDGKTWCKACADKRLRE